METEDIKNIFQRFLNNKHTEADFRLIQDHFQNELKREVLLSLIENELDKSIPVNEQRIDEIVSGADQYIFSTLQSRNKTAATNRSLWTRRISIAAAVAVFISGYFLFKVDEKHGTKVAISKTTVQDVPPGRNGATLTLANGRTIRLNDAATGQIAKQAGIIVTKAGKGQLIYQRKEGGDKINAVNSLTTAIGETYILTLPDQSKVWMNAASSLTYSAALFVNGVRRVRLDGEAYFQIAKDRDHPFIVETSNQEVKVLGTHFNIKSYHDETTVKTTLEEGSVRISNTVTGAYSTLVPGQMALNNSKTLKVLPADLELELAWKNDRFYFQDATLNEIMREVSRWYDVTVEYKGTPPTQRFSGGISRKSNLSSLLKVLALSKIKFTITNPPNQRLIVEQ